MAGQTFQKTDFQFQVPTGESLINFIP